MRTRLLVILALIAAAILAIPLLAVLFFVPVSSETSVTAGTPPPVDVRDGTPDMPDQLERTIALAQEALAARLGIDPSTLELVSLEGRDWSDGCLGLGGPHESCLAAIVPGYRFVFLAPDDDRHVVRASADGSAIRIEGDAGESPASPSAADLVRFALAQRLGDDSVEVVSAEAHDWPDGCLGLAGRDELCTEAIVPGYRLVLRSTDGEYVARTNREGSVYRLESSPVRLPATPDFAWGGALDTGCVEIALFAGGAGVVFGCGEAPTRFELTNEADLAYLDRLLTYQAIDEQGGEGRLVIRGSGDHEAGPGELRAVSEWAALVAQAAMAGRRGASWGLAIAWQERAGDECGQVQVERFGVAFTSRCTPGSEAGFLLLDEGQLETLYGWLDRLAPFEERAEGEESFVVFSGGGSEQADEAARRQIAEWVEALHPGR